MPGVPVICFIGPKNSGKTTLLEKVIRELSTAGLRLAAFKHDAHEFQIDHEGKDSWRFAEAGADKVIISSATKTALVERHAVAPSLESLVGRHARDVDLVLVEGYKASRFPKIVVHRSATGKPPLPVPESELVAVASDVPVATSALVVDLDDAGVIAMLLQRMVSNNASPAGVPAGAETEEDS
jgi:molybdopterin-guanine dinucleotide biosynthesis protein B